jgi:serine/threonine protein kinase
LDPTSSVQSLDKELTRLGREMSILRRIRHPNVACVLSHFRTPSSWIEVSDWFDGKTLETQWQSIAAATVAERASIALKVFGALDYCHERGVFHRNICADAVLVSSDLTDTRLCGFDLARDLASSSTLSSSALAHRDPRLVPPEELRGKVPNPRPGDVFQAGVLLYRLLEAGSWPFSSTLDLVKTPAAELRTFMGEEEAESASLRSLALRMMAVDPQERPDVLKRVEQEIEGALAGRSR